MRNSVCMFWDDNVCDLIYGKTILIKKFFGTMLTVFFIEMFIQYVQKTRCFVTVRSFCHTCASLLANKLDKASSYLLSTTFALMNSSNWPTSFISYLLWSSALRQQALQLIEILLYTIHRFLIFSIPYQLFRENPFLIYDQN